MAVRWGGSLSPIVLHARVVRGQPKLHNSGLVLVVRMQDHEKAFAGGKHYAQYPSVSLEEVIRLLQPPSHHHTTPHPPSFTPPPAAETKLQKLDHAVVQTKRHHMTYQVRPHDRIDHRGNQQRFGHAETTKLLVA